MGWDSGSKQTEGAKFWLAAMNELKNRGVQDLLIAVIDGLKDFPEAITAVFPDGGGANLYDNSND
jgi:transposase-like protein